MHNQGGGGNNSLNNKRASARFSIRKNPITLNIPGDVSMIGGETGAFGGLKDISPGLRTQRDSSESDKNASPT